MIILITSLKVSAQLPIQDYFQVDKDFVVKESSVFQFDKLDRDSILYLENHAKDYLKSLDHEVDQFKVASVYQYIINANHDLNRNDTALNYLLHSLSIPKLNNSKAAIDIHWDIFKVYSYSENYSGQLSQLDILEKLGAKYNFYKETEPGNLRKTRADVLFNAGFFTEAKSYFLKHIINDSLSVNPLKYAVINNDLAYIYEVLNQPDSAAIYRGAAFRALKSKRPIPYDAEYRSYIKDYIMLHDLKDKKIYTEESFSFATSFLENALQNYDGEIHTSIFASHFLSEYCFAQRNYSAALRYINQALDLGEGKLILRKLQEYMVLKSRILDKLGQEEKADSLLNVFRLTQSNKLAKNRRLELIRFEVNQIQNQKEKAEILALESLNKYNKTRYTLVFSVIILIIISIAFYITAQKNRSIKLAKIEVSKKLNEKELLLKELNHRVKNNLALILSLVQFQSTDAKEDHQKQKFLHLEKRINTIAIAHEQFIYDDNSPDGKFYDLEKYLIKIYQALTSIALRTVKLDVSIDRINLNLDTALPIGILLNELISNSIEHADLNSEALSVYTRITSKQDYIYLTYRDSGSGFVDKKNKRSLGLIIIESMVEQLKGNLERNNSQYDIILKYKT